MRGGTEGVWAGRVYLYDGRTKLSIVASGNLLRQGLSDCPEPKALNPRRSALSIVCRLAIGANSTAANRGIDRYGGRGTGLQPAFPLSLGATIALHLQL